MIVNTGLANSKGCEQKDKWETPDYIFNPLQELYGFTLDPCCEIQTAKCDRFFTEEENGLIQSWGNEIVYCNPPYSRGNIDKWMKKCYEESLNGAIVVALIPVSSSAAWWHNYVWRKADLFYYKGRIRFKGAKHTAPFSSVLAIYNTGVKPC